MKCPVCKNNPAVVLVASVQPCEDCYLATNQAQPKPKKSVGVTWGIWIAQSGIYNLRQHEDRMLALKQERCRWEAVWDTYSEPMYVYSNGKGYASWRYGAPPYFDCDYRVSRYEPRLSRMLSGVINPEHEEGS